MGPQTYLKVCGLETEGLSQLGVITFAVLFSVTVLLLSVSPPQGPVDTNLWTRRAAGKQQEQ